MAWEDFDINSPGLYAPRVNPKVHRAARVDGADEILQEPSVSQPDYVYDDDPLWAESVQSIPVDAAQKQTAHKQPKADHTGSGSPKQTRKRPPSREGSDQGKPPQRGKPYLYVGIITLCVAMLAVIGVMMMPQMAGYFWKDLGNYAFVNGEILRYDRAAAATYRQTRDYVRQEVIYPGVFVDGIHVGGMTLDEAKQTLDVQRQDTGALFSITVAIGNKTWLLDPSNIPATRDLGNVLERAYAVGRSNTTDILGTVQTPFHERANAVLALRENGVNLTTEASYDHEAVRALVDQMVAYVTREPVDASIASFDFNTRTFGYTDDQPGVTVDGEALYQKITAALDKREQGTTITAEPVITPAKVTKAQLSGNFSMIAAYTTDTTNESNRNNNIDLASQAINGTVLMPGEVFSFNAATGQRTISKGYKEAGAIAGGQSIDEVGGGICQVSSTLFNAVVRADLEIVERSPHAWPSTYVNRGEDATVNWPNLDFKFKNNKDTPVFVLTYFKDKKNSAEIWGMTLGEGVTIDLKSEVVKTIEPSSEVKYVYNANLPAGTSKQTVKARTGYVVDTYKIWYQNGTEMKREKLHSSTYRAYQRTIEYN